MKRLILSVLTVFTMTAQAAVTGDQANEVLKQLRFITKLKDVTMSGISKCNPATGESLMNMDSDISKYTEICVFVGGGTEDATQALFVLLPRKHRINGVMISVMGAPIKGDIELQ